MPPSVPLKHDTLSNRMDGERRVGCVTAVFTVSLHPLVSVTTIEYALAIRFRPKLSIDTFGVHVYRYG
jgi:hypothetical protein